MIKRLIFDVDNTLITNVSFTNAIIETFKQIDLYSEDIIQKFLFSLSTYENFYNNYNKHDYVCHIEQNINNNLPYNFLEIFFENLKSAISNKNEKLITTIKKLSEKYELVLLTNYFSKSQLNRLNNMGIGYFFIECHGQKLIKPYPNAFLQACGKNKPYECIMIGDDVVLDIEAAKNVGIHTILVNSKNNLTKNIDNIIVNSVEDINEELISNMFP